MPSPSDPPTPMASTSEEPLPSDGPQRDEQAIFSEIADLCSSPGYIHGLAALYLLNNFVTYGETLTEDDLLPNYAADRLIRTELSTLYGLLVRGGIDYWLPGADVSQTYIDRSVTLLAELHESLVRPSREQIFNAAEISNPDFNPFQLSAVLREAIFYGAESAFIFQYIELARTKYRAAEAWLIENMGFSIDAACDIANAILKIQSDRIPSVVRELPS